MAKIWTTIVWTIPKRWQELWDKFVIVMVTYSLHGKMYIDSCVTWAFRNMPHGMLTVFHCFGRHCIYHLQGYGSCSVDQNVGRPAAYSQNQIHVVNSGHKNWRTENYYIVRSTRENHFNDWVHAGSIACRCTGNTLSRPCEIGDILTGNTVI
jgi:hypothetical protein